MLSCDYNGWADAPEEEREAIDVFESTYSVPLTPVRVPIVAEGTRLPLDHLQRRAA